MALVAIVDRVGYGRSCRTNLSLIYLLQLRIIKTTVTYKIKIKHDNYIIEKSCRFYDKNKYTLFVEHFFLTYKIKSVIR